MPAGNLYTTLDSRDIIADFYPRLEASMESIWAPRVAIEIPSSRETEELAWLGQVPVMREWIGGRAEVPLNKYALTIRNYPYEATVPISVDDLRRDKTGQLRQRITDLADRTATHWNDLTATWIDNGEAGTSGLAYDGQFFYDTDHNESGTNQSNDLTVTEIPSANCSDPAVPTATEAANIITETVGYMMSLTDDQGEPINQSPTHVVIMVTRSAHWAAFNNAVTLNNLTSTVDNPVRGLTGAGWSFEVVFSTRLTAENTVRFFFGNPSMGATPLIRTNELPVETVLDGVGSHEETHNNRHIFGVKANRGIGYGQWQKSAFVALS